MSPPLLSVRHLVTRFRTARGQITAVNDVSFEVAAGETVAIVGESGSGKSVTALSILRLIPDPPGHIESGEILFDGQDLLKMSDDEMRTVRGNRIAMIFQEPMSSLNPSLTVSGAPRIFFASTIQAENPWWLPAVLPPTPLCVTCLRRRRRKPAYL